MSELGFSVDGVPVDPGPYRLTVHRLVGGVFTADAAAVHKMLPSPQLHPVRFLPRRTLVMINCTDADHHIGTLPSFRCVTMLITAAVTPGPRPGPWLTPILSDRSGVKNRLGLATLTSMSTSRVAAEFNRAVLGWPGFVADIRNEQHPELERFIATDGNDLIVQLSIRPTGKPEEWGPTLWAYGPRNDRVLGWRMDMSATTTQLRWGPGASRVTIGDHPTLAFLRDLDLRPRGVIGSFHTDGTRVIETPPFDVGPALGAPPHPAPPERTEGRYQVVTADGSDRIVDARHGRLGIDTAGEFVATPIKRGTTAGQG
jgi:hypothetical protein